MRVEFEPKISLGSVISIGCILCSLFAGACAFYFLIPQRIVNVEIRVAKVEEAVSEINRTISNRASIVDSNFGDLKTANAVLNSNQQQISKQLDEMQNQLRGIYQMQMNRKEAANQNDMPWRAGPIKTTYSMVTSQ